MTFGELRDVLIAREGYHLLGFPDCGGDSFSIERVDGLSRDYECSYQGGRHIIEGADLDECEVIECEVNRSYGATIALEVPESFISEREFWY